MNHHFLYQHGDDTYAFAFDAERSTQTMWIAWQWACDDSLAFDAHDFIQVADRILRSLRHQRLDHQYVKPHAANRVDALDEDLEFAGL